MGFGIALLGNCVAMVFAVECSTPVPFIASVGGVVISFAGFTQALFSKE